MNKTISIMALMLTLVVCCLCASGCSGDSGKELIGKWVPEGGFSTVKYTEFREDGVYGDWYENNGRETFVESGEWSASGGKVTLTINQTGQKIHCKYTLDGEKLTISLGGESEVYSKYGS